MSWVLALGLAVSACVMAPTVPSQPPPPQAPIAAAVPPPYTYPTPGPLTPPPPAPPAAPPGPLDGKIVVGLLLPLSGPNAALGRDLLDAAQLALFEVGGDNLAILPRDTQGTPAGAYDAAKAVLAEGAELILGPLTAGEAETVRPAAKAAHVAVVGFSNQVQAAGDGVFLLGLLPQQESQRLAAYLRTAGVEHIAALAPSSAYGKLAVDSFAQALAADGGTLAASVWYDPDSSDPRGALQRLGADKTQTYGALFIPEPSPRKLMSLASLLPIYDIDPHQVHLLGTDGWDYEALGSEPSLVGGWFAAPPPQARATFEQRFEAAHGRHPQRLAALAYEAVAMAAVLARSQPVDFSATALTNPSGFTGPDGLFRLTADGTTERGLAILQVERHGVTILSPAPESFQAGGQ